MWSTRATETTTASLKTIYVTAIDKNGGNYFSSEIFTLGSENSFQSSSPYYWPGDNSDLNFFAYAPSSTDLGGTLTITNATKTLADFAPAAAVADQKDFVTAKASGSKSASESTGVALNFKHQLSQIEIKAKNSNEAYNFKVVAVRICQPVSQGTFDFGTEGWTLAESKATYNVADFTDVPLTADAQSLMGVDGTAMIIPQQLTAWDPETDASNDNKGAYLSVKLQITTKAGARVYPAEADGNHGWAAVPVGTKLEAGMKYVYTLDFSNGAGYIDPAEPGTGTPGQDIIGRTPISFTVEVTPWTESNQPVDM